MSPNVPWEQNYPWLKYCLNSVFMAVLSAGGFAVLSVDSKSGANGFNVDGWEHGVLKPRLC
jgi:hypothetical protein